MTIGTPFHERTAPLNARLNWREWSGYFAASAYHEGHLIEYTAIREAAALIDVSPLYKYLVRGPDAERLVDRVITRDASKIKVGQVVYTPWCDEDGNVVDDGTVSRLDDTTFRWTAADPSLRWIGLNARGLDVEVEDVSESLAALALQGPLSRAVLEAATGEDWAGVRYYRRRASQIAGIDIDVTRTGYTGDLGYELWIPAEHAGAVWDAVAAAGRAFEARPAGMLALDVARVEAGLILIEVDYSSSRHAMNDEQRYSPYEIGLGRLVALDKPRPFVGQSALLAEQARGGPRRRLVGLELDWHDLEALYQRAGLAPVMPATTSRVPVPLYAGGRQVGKVTSTTWSPTLKRLIALASVDAAHERPGTELKMEWTVEARRGLARARVVPLPFFDPPRKRS